MFVSVCLLVIFTLFVPSPGFWTVQNGDFLSDDDDYDDDDYYVDNKYDNKNNDDNNHNNDDHEDNHKEDHTDCQEDHNENNHKNTAYGQHSALLYVCDSGVPILYHEFLVNIMGVVNTISLCL